MSIFLSATTLQHRATCPIILPSLSGEKFVVRIGFGGRVGDIEYLRIGHVCRVLQLHAAQLLLLVGKMLLQADVFQGLYQQTHRLCLVASGWSHMADVDVEHVGVLAVKHAHIRSHRTGHHCKHRGDDDILRTVHHLRNDVGNLRHLCHQVVRRQLMDGLVHECVGADGNIVHFV